MMQHISGAPSAVSTSTPRNPIVLPALRVEDLCAIVDRREQLPLDLSPFRMVSGTLATGDYSLHGLEHRVAIERKSLEDLVGCVGRERGRFERELQRLRGYATRAVVVEATWRELELGGWRGTVTPRSVTGSVTSWMSQHAIPFVFVEDHDAAARVVRAMLWHAARHAFDELKHLLGAVQGRRRPKVAEPEMVTA